MYLEAVDKSIRQEVIESLAGALPQLSDVVVDWRRLCARLMDSCLWEAFRSGQEIPALRLAQRLGEIVDASLWAPASVLQRSLGRSVRAHMQWLSTLTHQMEGVFGEIIESVEPGWGDLHAPGLTTSRVKLATGQVYFAKPGRQPRRLLRNLRDSSGPQVFDDKALTLDAGALYPERVPDSFAAVPPAQFWFDAGRFLALALAGGFSDGHYENVIAVGGKIAIIDDETVGNPQVRMSQRIEDTLLLELRTGASGVLVGAFVAKSRRLESRERPSLVGNRAALRLEGVPSIGVMRCPLTDVYGTVLNSTRPFLAGFEQGHDQYSLIPQEEFSTPVGARVVLRPTTVYTKMIERMRRLDPLCDETRRIKWAASVLQKLPAFEGETSLIEAEASDLVAGWIPRFLFLKANQLQTSDGRTVVLNSPLLSASLHATHESALDVLKAYLNEGGK